MCYYRGSSISETKAKIEAERQKKASAKRTETVDKLLHEADEVARKPADMKEPVPAK